MNNITVPLRTILLPWGVILLACLAVAGCGEAPQQKPTDAAKPTYPDGWTRALYSDAFWVVSRPLTGDRVLMEWFQKGLRRPCEAWSRTDNGTQFSIVWSRAAGGTAIDSPPTVADTFSMIARRSSDMKEIETAGAAGGGYGEGKVFEGAGSRLFVRVGISGSVVFVLMVRGDTTLDSRNPYLRAFFDGFEPVAR